MTSALFFRKCHNSEELKFLTNQLSDFGQTLNFVIEKVVKLDIDSFFKFRNNFLQDQDYISNIKDLLFMDENDCVHCALITDTIQSECYLIYPSGYDYARYIAIWNGGDCNV